MNVMKENLGLYLIFYVAFQKRCQKLKQFFIKKQSLPVIVWLRQIKSWTILIRDDLQIVFLILSQFEPIIYFDFPLDYQKNDFRDSKSWSICLNLLLILQAKFRDDPWVYFSTVTMASFLDKFTSVGDNKGGGVGLRQSIFSENQTWMASQN